MPDSRRHGLPDNLDPLVDTLSNVVGILVVVVALTQLQVGDALTRLIELEAENTPSGHRSLIALDRKRVELQERWERAEARRTAILTRSSGDIADAIEEAERALEQLAKLTETGGPVAGEAGLPIERTVEERRHALAEARAALADRREYASEIQTVPKEVVARLPDPTTVTGEEAWILCRYRRCYLADRTQLVDIGTRAIGQVLGAPHALRPDEYDSLAHHLRKRNVGHGAFRWGLVLDPEPRARLEWRSRDGGIEQTRLARSNELARWLAARSPDRDFIRFQVWNDSFETYLEARQVIEAAGFRAGWNAFGATDELDLSFGFGRPPPREGPVDVD